MDDTLDNRIKEGIETIRKIELESNTIKRILNKFSFLSDDHEVNESDWKSKKKENKENNEEFWGKVTDFHLNIYSLIELKNHLGDLDNQLLTCRKNLEILNHARWNYG